MTAIRPRRSVLYMPGSNARALEKSRDLPADVLILDLEDAVTPDSKEMARQQVCQVVRERPFGRREVVIRINSLETPWGHADLDAAMAARPDAILVPKISSPGDLAPVQARLGTGGNGIAIWAMIETAMAILNIAQIAGADGGLAALVIGSNDLVKAMGAKHMPARSNLLAALALSVTAARAHELAAIDGVFNDIADQAGFSAECRQGHEFGFDGKTLVHPSQLDECNRVFAPSSEEVAQARKLISAFDLAENRDKGAMKLDGHMVERLHAEIARRTVALANAIAELQQ